MNARAQRLAGEDDEDGEETAARLTHPAIVAF